MGNDPLMQMQADILGTPVVRSRVGEATALGAAYAAGLATGLWTNTDALREHWRADRRFEPLWSADVREMRSRGWEKAIGKAKGWTEEGPDEGAGLIPDDRAPGRERCGRNATMSSS